MKVKTLKKLIAVTAMAAVCCTLHMPVTAGAGTGDMAKAAPTCPPHHLVKTNERSRPSKTEKHEYLFSYTYDENGNIIDEQWSVCIKTTTYSQYDLECMNCNLLLFQMGPGEVTTHSSCGQADEVEPYSAEAIQSE